MEAQCDFVLIGWVTFVGLNLISNVVFEEAQIAQPQSSAFYQGRYRLRPLSNDTSVSDDEGALRLSMVAQDAGIGDVHVSSFSVHLSHGGVFSSPSRKKADFILDGIELSGAGILTSTGTTRPSKFKAAGQRRCFLHAVVNLVEPSEAVVEARREEGTDDGWRSSDGTRRSRGKDTEKSPRFWKLSGEVTAPDCKFSLEFSASAIDEQRALQKTMHYSVWAGCLTLVQVRLLFTQIFHTRGGAIAGNVSTLCIAMQICMDAYDSFLHFCAVVSSHHMFHAIATVSIFKFILFSAVEAGYFLPISRQRAIGGGFSWTYSRFYGILLLGYLIIYQYLEYLPHMVLCFQLFWVPQIVLDARQGSTSGLKPAYVGGMSLTRLLTVFYLWGCPYSVFNGEFLPRLPSTPNVNVCLGSALIQAAQLATLALQRYRGPRWFVPWICMPRAYNYFRSVDAELGTECVICMSATELEDGQRIITPCDHVFHRNCLQQWMDVKTECPTCRASLPPII
eukprot:TRINITY_DN27476_c0_g1_i1.p1 TRINITY_DN27476_c0_g1~~TRINITY_DN27476_c0_g1_i1.p1  ORF type:complete len:542 (-),score=62.38 TRINITY_DN27476_c0_g1_i1:175-1695(-)